MPDTVQKLDDREKLAQRFIDAAHAHGDEEGSEAEAGDLGDLFRAAFRLLTPQQLAAFFTDDDVIALLEVPEYGSMLDGLTGNAEPATGG